MCLAVPGKIISIGEGEQTMRTGKVSFEGVIREVGLAFVPEADIGDYVIVHAGFAISVIDEKEAQKTFDYLRRIYQPGDS
jgi:hydrogenase expression/formation protein HypC